MVILCELGHLKIQTKRIKWLFTALLADGIISIIINNNKMHTNISIKCWTGLEKTSMQTKISLDMSLLITIVNPLVCSIKEQFSISKHIITLRSNRYFRDYCNRLFTVKHVIKNQPPLKVI